MIVPRSGNRLSIFTKARMWLLALVLVVPGTLAVAVSTPTIAGHQISPAKILLDTCAGSHYPC